MLQLSQRALDIIDSKEYYEDKLVSSPTLSQCLCEGNSSYFCLSVGLSVCLSVCISTRFFKSFQ